MAAKYKVEPGSIAIAWLMARPSVASPIASATTIEQLNSLIKGAEIILSKSDVELLNKVSEEE
jgi:aryl-alcohol dehydrogenase-like predicted oxidoreductase